MVVPFTADELKLLSGLLDLAIKEAGLKLFANDGLLVLHSIVGKLQQAVDELAKAPLDTGKDTE